MVFMLTHFHKCFVELLASGADDKYPFRCLGIITSIVKNKEALQKVDESLEKSITPLFICIQERKNAKYRNEVFEIFT